MVELMIRWGPSWAEFGLTVFFAWLVAGWLVGGSLPAGKGENLTGHGAAGLLQATTIPDVSELIGVPIFGGMPKVAATSPSAVRPVVQSRLKIKLLGTVVAENHAAAIVELSSGGEQQVFFLGDSIQPGVKLHDVEAAAIVVERGGAFERIAMEEEPSAIGGYVMPDRRSGVKAPVQQRHVDRKHLQNQISDFPKLLSQARVVPHFLDGKSDGFVITDIVPGSLYGQVGLKNGDIIRKVNGQQVTSAQQAMAMYQALQNASSIDLELMRAGQVQQVHYDVR